MVVCITSARFNMQADILRREFDVEEIDEDEDGIADGEWVIKQDPESGEIIRRWQKNPEKETGSPAPVELESFPCVVRGIIDGGIRAAGTTERFGSMYENIDYIKVTFPASVNISKRDRITNVRDSTGVITWREEEIDNSPPTVFNVNGVTPIIDPFGRHIESFALCERAERQ